MKKKDIFTKVLASIGAILVWFTLLAPVLLTIVFLFRSGRFHFDYLMPAELFPLALVGGGFLLWAALRARRRTGFIITCFGLAAGSLVISQILAVLTGLASGDTEPGGWQWALVLTFLGIYVLALIGLGVGGVMLHRDLREKAELV